MIAKRIFDIIISTIVIVILAPLFLLIAIAVKIESRGPVFYKSLRVGRNRREFYLYKFRSMVKDADQIGGGLTLEKDFRLTRVGEFLRKWKIDELPNFINVLIGEMSLVGPRPELPEYVRYYSKEQRKVLSVRPGITDIPMSGMYYNEQKILSTVKKPQDYYISVILQDFLKLNLEYVAKYPSFLLDIKIIGRTTLSIFFNNKLSNTIHEQVKVSNNEVK